MVCPLSQKPCTEDTCPWFITESKKCSVKTIAESIYCLSKIIKK